MNGSCSSFHLHPVRGWFEAGSRPSDTRHLWHLVFVAFGICGIYDIGRSGLDDSHSCDALSPLDMVSTVMTLPLHIVVFDELISFDIPFRPGVFDEKIVKFNSDFFSSRSV
jgi:hypothetical protein